MAKNFKDDFIAIQTNLRDNPGAATATFEASTRQIAGLLSDAAIRDFTIKIDEPATLGGTDRGPNPVELVLAALGACQEITSPWRIVAVCPFQFRWKREAGGTIGQGLHGDSSRVIVPYVRMARKPSKHVGTLGDIVDGYNLTLNCQRCCHRAEDAAGFNTDYGKN
jgi:hypothetical protein